MPEKEQLARFATGCSTTMPNFESFSKGPRCAGPSSSLKAMLSPVRPKVSPRSSRARSDSVPPMGHVGDLAGQGRSRSQACRHDYSSFQAGRADCGCTQYTDRRCARSQEKGPFRPALRSSSSVSELKEKPRFSANSGDQNPKNLHFRPKIGNFGTKTQENCGKSVFSH